MIASFANIHIIPANDRVAERLTQIVPGHLVQLEGLLVDVLGPDDWDWRTSVIWEDKGQGSCEILFTEYLHILPNPE